MKSIANIIHHKTFPLNILASNGRLRYFENSKGYWVEQEYDSNGKEIYFETSSGYLRDIRV